MQSMSYLVITKLPPTSMTNLDIKNLFKGGFALSLTILVFRSGGTKFEDAILSIVEI